MSNRPGPFGHRSHTATNNVRKSPPIINRQKVVDRSQTRDKMVRRSVNKGR